MTISTDMIDPASFKPPVSTQAIISVSVEASTRYIRVFIADFVRGSLGLWRFRAE